MRSIDYLIQNRQGVRQYTCVLLAAVGPRFTGTGCADVARPTGSSNTKSVRKESASPCVSAKNVSCDFKFVQLAKESGVFRGRAAMSAFLQDPNTTSAFSPSLRALPRPPSRCWAGDWVEHRYVQHRQCAGLQSLTISRAGARRAALFLVTRGRNSFGLDGQKTTARAPWLQPAI